MRRGLIRWGLAWLWLTAPATALAQTGAVVGVVHVPAGLPTRAVVFLVTDSASTQAPAPNPDSDPDPSPRVIDQRDLHFVPHTMAVLQGQRVAFRNSDPLLHNVFSPPELGDDFDLGTYPIGERRMHDFRRLGGHVILCHIHPEMEAYVVVIPSPYHALADADGSFRIEEVPSGSYTLKVWHPRSAPYEVAAEIRAGTTLHLEIQLERRRKTGRRGN